MAVTLAATLVHGEDGHVLTAVVQTGLKHRRRCSDRRDNPPLSLYLFLFPSDRKPQGAPLTLPGPQAVPWATVAGSETSSPKWKKVPLQIR